MNDYTACMQAIDGLLQDPVLRERRFYPEFQRTWEALLKKTSHSGETYFDADSPAGLTVPCTYGGLDFCFHLDQSKMADWYYQEVKRKKRVVFEPKRFKRSFSGKLSYHDSVCHYDPALPEAALEEKDRNILAAAFPGRPAELYVVYGNKWVEKTINPLRRSSVALFLIRTPFVPAFLLSPFEVCLYLFLMDCCIIQEDYQKVKDEELKPLLHIFQPSPMLRIKGLL